MKPFETLLATFEEHFARFEGSAPIKFLQSSDFGPHHYASILREIYFYTRENPQFQSAMTLGFRGTRRGAVRRVLGHALDEVGHEKLALNDLAALGHDTSSIHEEEPLPSTVPLIAYPALVLSHRNPIGYLGQILFLEFMPTRSGAAYMKALTSAGIPAEAMTFLAEHAAVDEHHNRLMRRHVEDLVLNDDDLKSCQVAIAYCAHHYSQMLVGALDASCRFAGASSMAGAGRHVR